MVYNKLMGIFHDFGLSSIGKVLLGAMSLKGLAILAEDDVTEITIEELSAELMKSPWYREKLFRQDLADYMIEQGFKPERDAWEKLLQIPWPFEKSEYRVI